MLKKKIIVLSKQGLEFKKIQCHAMRYCYHSFFFCVYLTEKKRKQNGKQRWVSKREMEQTFWVLGETRKKVGDRKVLGGMMSDSCFSPS